MNILKRLFTPTHSAIVNDELTAARLQLLSAENDLEHVQAQVNLLNTRIARLEGKLTNAAAQTALTNTQIDTQFYTTRLHSTTSQAVNRPQKSEHEIPDFRHKTLGKTNVAV
ncbi:hypothetical protein ACVBEF_19520 [Glaciimonas sp. GG7]